MPWIVNDKQKTSKCSTFMAINDVLGKKQVNASLLWSSMMFCEKQVNAPLIWPTHVMGNFLL